MFAIEMPSNIEQFMTGLRVPLLFTPESIYCINMTGELLPQRRIVESSKNTHAFCYLNVPVTLGGVTVVDI